MAHPGPAQQGTPAGAAAAGAAPAAGAGSRPGAAGGRPAATERYRNSIGLGRSAELPFLDAMQQDGGPQAQPCWRTSSTPAPPPAPPGFDFLPVGSRWVLDPSRRWARLLCMAQSRQPHAALPAELIELIAQYGFTGWAARHHDVHVLDPDRASLTVDSECFAAFPAMWSLAVRPAAGDVLNMAVRVRCANPARKMDDRYAVGLIKASSFFSLDYPDQTVPHSGFTYEFHGQVVARTAPVPHVSRLNACPPEHAPAADVVIHLQYFVTQRTVRVYQQGRMLGDAEVPEQYALRPGEAYHPIVVLNAPEDACAVLTEAQVPAGFQPAPAAPHCPRRADAAPRDGPISPARGTG
eukprot:TRINITY_DN11093_c0_g1_i2.p1 TRINITY_DN11093_c0_g1~~TRINITY_DN11093_c0_g1_i2.p1  ORF type:complete len:374 (+),score=53.26 TRINITY_DN11093_c0_g1_i2:69-1124(+)